MRKTATIFLNFYKVLLSPIIKMLFGGGCRFTPTCSEYAKEAIEKYGIISGSVMSLKRISKCHPFSEGGFDPVS